MRWIRQIILFLIKSNLFIALCAVAFVSTGTKLLGTEPLTLLQSALIFTSTFLTYNLTIFLVNLFDQKKGKAAGKMGWFLHHRYIIYPLLGLSLGILIWVFPYHSSRQSFFFIHLAVISILYNVPDRMADTAYRSIRSIPLLKVFLIAYVWAAIGVLYPALLNGSAGEKVYTLFLLFFSFIVAITLPFDIRDYAPDQKKSLLTVPGIIGINATKWLAMISMLVYCSGLVLSYGLVLQAGIILLISLPLIWFSSEEKKSWYFTGLLDGIILLQFFLLRG